MASISANYVFSYVIGQARTMSGVRATTTLSIAVASNLGLLAYFKYANFFIANVSMLTGAELNLVNIVLPLGISFFTFTQIAFLVDVYRGLAREYNFVHYILFVTYFPHLIAGPVLHHKQMMPQFDQAATYRIDTENISIGLTIFVIGLTKKVLLADQFALQANPVFDLVARGGEPQLIEAWIGALAYTLQLYFDFSGYSDMAIGLSRMFNVKLPLNFDSPYKASNIIEFWRRWHITLSTFLRDYLYFALGGSRKGLWRRYINLMATMLLGGLWHGAGWTFVIWGGLHGFYLVVNHGWRRLIRTKESSSGWRAITNIGLTFLAVVIAWVPFRATDLDAAQRMWLAMLGVNGVSLPSSLEPLLSIWLGSIIRFDGLAPLTGLRGSEIALTIPLGLAIVWLLPNTQQWMALHLPAWDIVRAPSRCAWQLSGKFAVACGTLFALALLMLTRESAFLYYQF